MGHPTLLPPIRMTRAEFDAWAPNQDIPYGAGWNHEIPDELTRAMDGCSRNIPATTASTRWRGEDCRRFGLFATPSNHD